MAEISDKSALLYQHIMDELKELRNERWKLAIYFTTIAIGNIYLLKENDLVSGLFELFRWMSIVVQSASIIIFSWLIVRNHKYLTRTRNIRNKLEAAFDFHSVTDSTGDHVLPQEWKDKKSKFRFELVDVVLPLTFFTVLCQVSAIYIIYIK